MVHNPIQKITFGRAAPGILVRDIQSAYSFYSSVLGFEKVFENGTPVGFMVLKKDGAEIYLNQHRDHRPTTVKANERACEMTTSDADRITDLYERHARAWDGDRGRSLMEQGWLDRFRAIAGDDAEVLDLGCGGGEPIARELIARGHIVTGVDASPTLIGLCRARFPDHTWIVGDMRGLELGTRFRGILAWDSFFHLTQRDQRAMFPVFAAHAAPGAALMFTSGPANGEAIGAYRGEPLYHASLAPEEYQRLLDAHGFEVAAHIANDPACGGHTVWLARRV